MTTNVVDVDYLGAVRPMKAEYLLCMTLPPFQSSGEYLPECTKSNGNVYKVRHHDGETAISGYQRVYIGEVGTTEANDLVMDNVVEAVGDVSIMLHLGQVPKGNMKCLAVEIDELPSTNLTASLYDGTGPSDDMVGQITVDSSSGLDVSGEMYDATNATSAYVHYSLNEDVAEINFDACNAPNAYCPVNRIRFTDEGGSILSLSDDDEILFHACWDENAANTDCPEVNLP